MCCPVVLPTLVGRNSPNSSFASTPRGAPFWQVRRTAGLLPLFYVYSCRLVSPLRSNRFTCFVIPTKGRYTIVLTHVEPLPRSTPHRTRACVCWLHRGTSSFVAPPAFILHWSPDLEAGGSTVSLQDSCERAVERTVHRSEKCPRKERARPLSRRQGTEPRSTPRRRTLLQLPRWMRSPPLAISRISEYGRNEKSGTPSSV